MQDSLSLIINMLSIFKGKYIYNMEQDICHQINNVNKNNTKEKLLLDSIGELLNNNNADNIMKTMTTISDINKTLYNYKQEIEHTNKILNDKSIKEDGVYDIDEDCLLSISNKGSNIQNLLLLILIMKICIIK